MLQHKSHVFRLLHMYLILLLVKQDNFDRARIKARISDSLFYVYTVFCFRTRLSGLSWVVWITVAFPRQTVESFQNLSAISSHKAVSKATNTALLSKHITAEACIAVASVKLPSRPVVSMGMLYICCRVTVVINEQVSVHNFPLIVCHPYSEAQSPPPDPCSTGSSLRKHRSEFFDTESGMERRKAQQGMKKRKEDAIF